MVLLDSACNILQNINTKEKQVAIRKPSSEINAKKQRETIEWERTRDLFKKIRDTKGTFHAKMSTIKDRSGMDLTEAEDTKKRWHEYTELQGKKIFMTQITTMV